MTTEELIKYIERQILRIEDEMETSGIWEELYGQKKAYEDILKKLKHEKYNS